MLSFLYSLFYVSTIPVHRELLVADWNAFLNTVNHVHIRSTYTCAYLCVYKHRTFNIKSNILHCVRLPSLTANIAV